jgi:hypothetical protein
MISGLSGLSGLSGEFGAAGLQPAPTDLVATPESATEIDLTWTDPVWISPALSSVAVYRSTSPTSGFIFETDVAAGTETYADTGVIAGTTYYYYVVGFDGMSYYGKPSLTVSGLTYPDAPSLVAVNNFIDDGTMQFTIDALVQSAVNYNIYGGSDEINVGAVPSGLVFSEIDVIDAGLSPGTEYNFTITAVNGTGEGLPSNAVNQLVTFPQQAPPTVTDDGSGGNNVRPDNTYGTYSNIIVNGITTIVSGWANGTPFDDNPPTDGPMPTYTTEVSDSFGNQLGPVSEGTVGPN